MFFALLCQRNDDHLLITRAPHLRYLKVGIRAFDFPFIFMHLIFSYTCIVGVRAFRPQDVIVRPRAVKPRVIAVIFPFCYVAKSKRLQRTNWPGLSVKSALSFSRRTPATYALIRKKVFHLIIPETGSTFFSTFSLKCINSAVLNN